MTKKPNSSLLQISSLALIVGLAGCALSPTDVGDQGDGSDDPDATPDENDNGGQDPSVAGEDPFDIDAFLGVPISGCASSGWNATTSTLTLTLAGAPAVLTATGGKITANGITCVGTVASVANTALTTTTVAKIVITGTGGDDKVILDLLPGTFGTKIFGATGGVTLNLAAGNDQFLVRGTTAIDSYKFGKSSTTTDTFYELSGDKIADVKVTMSGTLVTSASLGAGADIFTGVPATGDIASFAGAAITTTKISNKVVIYGGAGADTITGGDGDDELHGGDDADTFKMGAADDGGDTYIGDAGEDLVDYSNRTGALAIDIGAATPTIFSTLDLSTLDYSTGGDLDALTLKIKLDGGSATTVTFADPTDPNDVVAQINDATDPDVVAFLWGKNYLALTTSTLVADDGGIEVTDGTANSVLGLTDDTEVTAVADADDGLGSENDDVQYTTENITGGSGNDVIFGDWVRNVIKGGAGDDTISGGHNGSFASALVADSLQGEAGDDTFYAPQANLYAVIAGGTGTDTVNYSGRGATLTLTNEGTANDGAGSENNNVGSDVEGMTGGFGNDTITGGANSDVVNGGGGDDILSGAAGDDTLIGGAGDDEINGGAGTDLADYSSYDASQDLTITLCVSVTATGAAAGCPAANDGDPNEDDQVANIEWVKGGAGDDSITASTVGTTLEGGAGADTLTGGAASDALWGDAGNDTLDGGDGDDTIEGNAGDDEIIGGAGDGDICVSDAADVTDPPVSCEL